LHPTVHKTHGGGPAVRSSRRAAGVPTARTVRRGVEQRGASPVSVRRHTFTTVCWRLTAVAKSALASVSSLRCARVDRIRADCLLSRKSTTRRWTWCSRS